MHLLNAARGGSGSQGFRVKKWLLIMQFISLLLVICGISASAAGFSQHVTLDVKKASATSVLKEINRQTGYTFTYAEELISGQTVSVKMRDQTVQEALRRIFEHLPVDFEILHTTVVLRKKEINHPLLPTITDNVLPPITGKIIGPDGQPVAGANVLVKGTNRGTTTNNDGSFTIDAAPGEILIISSIGYNENRITITNGQNIGTVNLILSDNKLDEVQIIAYGQTSQRLSTSNTGTVKAATIEKQPVSNPLLALSGRIPGLQITQATGYAGSGVTVRIQGANSLQNANDPLYVIDGVPYSSQLPPTFNSIVGNSGTPSNQFALAVNGNPLNFINPGDIESIDVLKDADATAIYGSRAANGAILITTKKGAAGKMQLLLDAQSGIGNISRKMDLLNAAQYEEMRREALKNDERSPDENRDHDLFTRFGWDPKRNTDWQKTLIGNTAQYTNLRAGISGGTSTVQYNIGADYKRETTVIPGDFNDNKFAVHFNLNTFSANKKLNISITGNYLTDINRLPSNDLAFFALSVPPGAPSLYDENGHINWALNENGSSTWSYSGNPIAPLFNKYKNTTSNLVGSGTIKYTVTAGLDIKSSFGYNKLNTNEINAFPLVAVLPDFLSFIRRGAFFGNSEGESFIIEPQINYKKSLGIVQMDALVGGTMQENNLRSLRQKGEGFSSDAFLEDLILAPDKTIEFSIANRYVYRAIFARFNFVAQHKYVVNLTARRDGSSRFGPENRYNNFGAIGGAWIFSEEKLTGNLLPFLSFGKLRASYGTTGNDQIGDYQYLSLYQSLPLDNYQGTAGIAPLGLANPYIQWEETKKLQGGIELGLLKNELLINLNYFHNRSGNQLVQYALPSMTGFGSILSNFPAIVQNNGWEISVVSNNIRSNHFTWSTNFNITIPKNKLVRFDDIENSTYANLLFVGKPIKTTRVFEYAGVNAQSGLYQFTTSKGELTSAPNEIDDRTIYENTDPKFYGGLQNTITYKNFSLDFLFAFVKQSGVGRRFGILPGYFSGTSGNQPANVLAGRWQKPGDIASIQRFNANNMYDDLVRLANSSNEAWEDASFIRLKNISLSWSFPTTLVQRAKLNNAQLYLQAQNLLTISNYTGIDPESRAINALPPLRVVTAGIRVSL